MDSLSQIALGASVSVAVMGRRTAVWKAALWGGVAATLPDLDVVIDHGDAVSNMVMHRANSHALFWLSVISPAVAAVPASLHGERPWYRWWWLAIWLALATHPLLDLMTVYGTQVLRPFSAEPYGLGSIFIIDPLYTVPLLVGLAAALGRRDYAGLPWARAGLLLSTLYLAWTAVAQAYVRAVAVESLPPVVRKFDRILVTPAPFNTVLWRVVAMRPDGGYEEGFYSFAADGPRIRFTRIAPTPVPDAVRQMTAVQRMTAFSDGFCTVHVGGGKAWVTDLRMGQEPYYSFSFLVAKREGDRWLEVTPRNEGSRGDVKRGLRWIWARMWDRNVAPL